MLRKLLLATILPLVGVALWYYPLVVSTVKPVLSSSVKNAVQVNKNQPLQDNTFIYPRLGITAPLSESSLTSPLKTQDWKTIKTALQKGISLAYTSESFQAAHLLFITGHSSDTYPHQYGSIFAALGQAQKGDTFDFQREGKRYTYAVIDKKVIHPNDVAQFLALEPADKSIQHAVLVTCWPPLTTQKRMVVVGERKLQE